MAITFSDRVSTYPNRYKITQEGGATVYATLERADSPTAVGTPLNASTLNAAFAEKAPAGYGLGTMYPQAIMSAGELDTCRTCGFYCAVYSGTICGIYFDYADLIVYPIYGNECVQELRPVNTNYCFRRFYYADAWSEWEQVGAVMKVLWTNDNPTQDFPAKTISPVGLSNYQAIYVQCVRSTDDQTLSGSALVWLDMAPAYLLGTTDQYGVTRRKVTATKTGITFSGFSSAITSDGSSNEIPVVIYGIKGIGL